MAHSTEPLILIVEDNPDLRALIDAAFKKSLAQANLLFVLSIGEVQAYLKGESPHHDGDRYPVPSLIVLDLGLPGITGFEILEWMAEWDWLKEIPVIVFTALVDPEHERIAYALGVRRYMRKPHDFGELVAAVREELGLPAMDFTGASTRATQDGRMKMKT